MPDIQVKKYANNFSGNGPSFRDIRGDKSDDAVGTINATDYSVGDTLVFNVGAKEILYAKFVSAHGGSLEVFNGADLSSPITFDASNNGNESDISFYVRYVRGAGVSGNVLKLNVISTSN